MERKERWAQLYAAAQRMEEGMVEDFRFLHQHPELSGEEYQTAAWIQAQLMELDCEIHNTKGPGFYAVLDSGTPGPSLAIRADLDALPVQEDAEHLQGKRLVYSQVEGRMHACGHDAHMAILLTIARVLAEQKSLWCGRVLFLLESGEETGVGIAPMLEALQGEEIQAVYGVHVRSALPAGTLAVCPGAIMAGTVMFTLHIQGRGGHSSRPDLACNPIFAAAQVLNAWGSSWINQMDPTSPLTLGIGRIRGGEAANVIPDSVEIAGTVRFFAKGRGREAFARLLESAKHVAAALETTVEGEITHCNEPVWNDPNLVAALTHEAEGLAEAGLAPNYKEAEPWFASETFSHYSKRAPSVFVLLGIAQVETGCGADHHNRKFCVEESALSAGVQSGLLFVCSQMPRSQGEQVEPGEENTKTEKIN